ncbi:hypothetical protein FOZ62_027798, partial [Perkinsus olseni]
MVNGLKRPWSLPRWEASACVIALVVSLVVSEYLVPRKVVELNNGELVYYNYIEGSIPLYLSLIAFEFIILHIHKRRLSSSTEPDWIPESGYYEAADCWSSVAAGAMDVLLSIMVIERFTLKEYVCRTGGVDFLLELDNEPQKRSHADFRYDYIHDNYAIGNLDLTWAPQWVKMLVFGSLIELCYYSFHRMSHEIGFIWAMGHANHHSSEHFNFSTALRQGYLQQAVSWVFYLPLAVLGVPTDVSMTYRTWNIMYQFWIHTSIVGSLPWPLEEIMMTPSNHRIHHDRRLHKNFGGTLVVYDKLFGTYLKEPAQTACVYGWAVPSKSWVDSVFQLQAFSRQSRSWWKGPGYYTTTAARVCPPAPRLARLTRSTTASLGVKVYIAVQFLVSTLCGLLLESSDRNMVLAAYSLFSYIAQGFLFDGNATYE